MRSLRNSIFNCLNLIAFTSVISLTCLAPNSLATDYDYEVILTLVPDHRVMDQLRLNPAKYAGKKIMIIDLNKVDFSNGTFKGLTPEQENFLSKINAKSRVTLVGHGAAGTSKLSSDRKLVEDPTTREKVTVKNTVNSDQLGDFLATKAPNMHDSTLSLISCHGAEDGFRIEKTGSSFFQNMASKLSNRLFKRGISGVDINARVNTVSGNNTTGRTVKDDGGAYRRRAYGSKYAVTTDENGTRASIVDYGQKDYDKISKEIKTLTGKDLSSSKLSTTEKYQELSKALDKNLQDFRANASIGEHISPQGGISAEKFNELNLNEKRISTRSLPANLDIATVQREADEFQQFTNVMSKSQLAKQTFLRNQTEQTGKLTNPDGSLNYSVVDEVAKSELSDPKNPLHNEYLKDKSRADLQKKIRAQEIQSQYKRKMANAAGDEKERNRLTAEYEEGKKVNFKNDPVNLEIDKMPGTKTFDYIRDARTLYTENIYQQKVEDLKLKQFNERQNLLADHKEVLDRYKEGLDSGSLKKADYDVRVQEAQASHEKNMDAMIRQQSRQLKSTKISQSENLERLQGNRVAAVFDSKSADRASTLDSGDTLSAEPDFGDAGSGTTSGTSSGATPGATKDQRSAGENTSVNSDSNSGPNTTSEKQSSNQTVEPQAAKDPEKTTLLNSSSVDSSDTTPIAESKATTPDRSGGSTSNGGGRNVANANESASNSGTSTQSRQTDQGGASEPESNSGATKEGTSSGDEGGGSSGKNAGAGGGASEDAGGARAGGSAKAGGSSKFSEVAGKALACAMAALMDYQAVERYKSLDQMSNSFVAAKVAVHSLSFSSNGNNYIGPVTSGTPNSTPDTSPVLPQQQPQVGSQQSQDSLSPSSSSGGGGSGSGGGGGAGGSGSGGGGSYSGGNGSGGGGSSGNNGTTSYASASLQSFASGCDSNPSQSSCRAVFGSMGKQEQAMASQAGWSSTLNSLPPEVLNTFANPEKATNATDTLASGIMSRLPPTSDPQAAQVLYSMFNMSPADRKIFGALLKEHGLNVSMAPGSQLANLPRAPASPDKKEKAAAITRLMKQKYSIPGANFAEREIEKESKDIWHKDSSDNLFQIVSSRITKSSLRLNIK